MTPAVWTRGAAIRPVPPGAVLGERALRDVEARLSHDEADATLDRAFDRFEETQPHLADRVAEVLSKPLDETALALGYFLSIAVWLAFEAQFGGKLRAARAEEIEAVDASIRLEDELRAEHVEEPASAFDVVAHEQPAAMSFIHEHVDAALEVRSGEAVDVDDVDLVYRTAIVVLLSLSHAVRASDAPSGGPEMLA